MPPLTEERGRACSGDAMQRKIRCNASESPGRPPEAARAGRMWFNGWPISRPTSGSHLSPSTGRLEATRKMLRCKWGSCTTSTNAAPVLLSRMPQCGSSSTVFVERPELRLASGSTSFKENLERDSNESTSELARFPSSPGGRCGRPPRLSRRRPSRAGCRDTGLPQCRPVSGLPVWQCGTPSWTNTDQLVTLHGRGGPP